MISSFRDSVASGRGLLLTAALVVGGCAPSAATTRPAAAPTGADVLAAHGYAMPRAQLADHIIGSLRESGWTVKSSDAEVGVFVAQKHALLEPGYTLTVVIKPAGDRLRVDVTSTCDQPQLMDGGFNKRNVWAFYDALDKRAGDAPPPP